MPMYDRKCNRCNKIQEDCWEPMATADFPCQCGGIMARVILPVRSLSDGRNRGVIGDECDITIRNGLCNPDGSPRRYTSKTEIRREEARRGYTNHVEHIPGRSGDKSKHTSRWI